MKEPIAYVNMKAMSICDRMILSTPSATRLVFTLVSAVRERGAVATRQYSAMPLVAVKLPAMLSGCWRVQGRSKRTALARPVGERVVDEREHEDLALPAAHEGGTAGRPVLRREKWLGKRHDDVRYSFFSSAKENPDTCAFRFDEAETVLWCDLHADAGRRPPLLDALLCTWEHVARGTETPHVRRRESERTLSAHTKSAVGTREAPSQTPNTVYNSKSGRGASPRTQLV